MTRSRYTVVRWWGVLGAAILIPGNVTGWRPSPASTHDAPSNGNALAASVVEVEPNDSPTQATLVAMGDTASAAISPAPDIDWYAVDVTAGTVLDLDVDGAALGSPINPEMALIAPDSETVLAVNDNWDGLDPRIVYSVDVTARYFVHVRSYSGTGDYLIRFGTMTLDEVEPNDVPAQAGAIAVGDSLMGSISPGSDVDYYAVDVSTPLILRAAADAPYAWFPLALDLYGADGTTTLGSGNNGSSPYATVDEYLTAGRHYLAVRQIYSGPPGGRIYHLGLQELPHGPGDPVTILAQGLGNPRDLVALRNGDFAVLDAGQRSIQRVTARGDATVLATMTYGSLNTLAVDGYGDVLASGYDDAASRAVIWRISLQGTRTEFVADSTASLEAMTIGPDGDVWVTSCGSTCPQLRRYDPFGRLKSTQSLSVPVTRLAFSPSGDLYATGGFQYVYRLGTTITPVIYDSTGDLEDLAFDEDGYLYVAKGAPGQIRVYSPSFALLENPFARSNLSEPLNLAFGRDTSDAMTARLFVTNGVNGNAAARGTLAEVNPSGLRAVGWPIGVGFARLATTATPAGWVGSTYVDTLRVEAGSEQSVVWSVIDGSLPSGVTLTPGGVLSGIPLEPGVFEVWVRGNVGERLAYGDLKIWIKRATFTAQNAADVLLGVPDALDSAQQVFMDRVGNNNGRYDIGDLRAWLLPQGAGRTTGASMARSKPRVKGGAR